MDDCCPSPTPSPGIEPLGSNPRDLFVCHPAARLPWPVGAARGPTTVPSRAPYQLNYIVYHSIFEKLPDAERHKASLEIVPSAGTTMQGQQAMAHNKTLYAISALCAASLALNFSNALSQPSGSGRLGNNEGILVDVKSFQISQGKAKSEPSAMLVKYGARQVGDGAVVFRSADKLYIIDGDPRGMPQAINPGEPLPTTIDGFNRLFENF